MYPQQCLIKAKLIYECEIHNNKYDDENCYDFPRYFILRRVKDNKKEDSQEWLGFVKDIKRTLEKTKSQINSNINQSKVGLEREIS